MGELAVVLVVALIFVGPKMLPEIATGIGKVIREIRKATSDIRQDIEIDDMIRGPLRELRDAATLPPEELKRRDAAKAAQRKAEQEMAERKKQEQEEQAKAAAAAAAAAVKPAGPADVISAGGTMIASPPPTDDLQTLTPLPELQSPPPVVTAKPPRLPTPPLPPPRVVKAPPPSDATVIDLQAQLKATTEAGSTLAGRPVLAPNSTLPKPPEGKKG